MVCAEINLEREPPHLAADAFAHLPFRVLREHYFCAKFTR